jgi:4-amino-4-deoxy-L-arabinose transferase-like glycosyltransferase
MLPLALTVIAALVVLFLAPPLSRTGLWDPYELNVADLARRIALNLHGAGDLALSQADNSLPHLNDLGRPQLPFTSIALGFKLFGLHEWAGRLPLATWGLLGVLATYGFVARLFDRRAALYASLALLSMPLYFVQARSLLGDIVAMSAFAMAFGGFAVAVFDRTEEGGRGLAVRGSWLVIGILGCAAGLQTRGALLGIGVPLLAVATAWGISWAATTRKMDLFGDGVAVLAALFGLMALLWAVAVINAPRTPNLSLAVGAMLRPPQKYPTFDVMIGQLGHALAPWSAFVPFAFGRLFFVPTHLTGATFQRESFGRAALLVAAAGAYAAHAYLGAHTELIAFVGPSVFAAACGIALRDFERGGHPSIAMGASAAVFLGLFLHDFRKMPEKAFSAFWLSGPTFPESFKERASLLWLAALALFAVFVLLTWIERDPEREPFDPRTYAKVARNLRTAADGLLVLGWMALVTGAAIAAALVYVGTRTRAKWLPQVSANLRDIALNAWWALALAPVVIVFGAMFAADVWHWAFSRAQPLSKRSFVRGFEPIEGLLSYLRAPQKAREAPESRPVAPKAEVPGEAHRETERAAAIFVVAPLMLAAIPAGVLFVLLRAGVRVPAAVGIAIPTSLVFFLAMGFLGDLLRGSRASLFAWGGLASGLVLCAAYYPALANQLSPKEVFESYQTAKRGAEPLALFGVGGRTAAYYAGSQPDVFGDSQSAFEWLVGDASQRRFLAIRTEELPRLNMLFRERTSPRQNLPVVDARSSQIVLAASSIPGNRPNANPFDAVVLSDAPTPRRPLNVNLEDRLLVLGYDITDANGRIVDVVAPSRPYRMRTYYKVLAPLTSEWQAFLHIDGYRRRHNGDHKPMNGKYPMALWLKDDIMVDDHEFTLEANFSPGAYSVYFGLFMGDTRLKVTSGPSDGENRINGGTLRVQ